MFALLVVVSLAFEVFVSPDVLIVIFAGRLEIEARSERDAIDNFVETLLRSNHLQVLADLFLFSENRLKRINSNLVMRYSKIVW